MAASVNIHFQDSGDRTLFYPPYTIENLADLSCVIMEVSFSEEEFMSAYSVYYKENGNEIQISSSEELGRYIFASIPTSDIYIQKIQASTTHGSGSTENKPIRIHFVDEDSMTPLTPPLTFENLSDLVSAALDMPPSEYMAQTVTTYMDHEGNKVRIFRGQDVQHIFDNRPTGLDLYIERRNKQASQPQAPSKPAQSPQAPPKPQIQAIWVQPEGVQLPIRIGNARDLGLNSNHTALCWIKHTKGNNCRYVIFNGDWRHTYGGGFDRRCENVLWHCELRNGNKFMFGFGYDDTYSQRVCRVGVWEHVAFVFSKQEGKKIIVNGEDTQVDGRGTLRGYEGNENIWLGKDFHQDVFDWEGKIHGAMIFNGALTSEKILQIAAQTRPSDEPTCTWKQPPGTQIPIRWGSASELGLTNSDHTAMCWVKLNKTTRDRYVIFNGDWRHTYGGGFDRRCENVLWHCESRGGVWMFGFGYDDTYSRLASPDGVWKHVAFVYSSKDGKKIVVNGVDTSVDTHGTRRGYEGTENIWLGKDFHHDNDDWKGQIHGAMIFNEALSLEKILEISRSSHP